MILSSGGESDGVPAGGVAVYITAGKLAVSIQIRELQTEWSYKELHVQPDIWFHLMIVWKMNSELHLYIDFGIDAIVSGKSYTPSPTTTSDHMFIGRPSDSNDARYFGRKLVTLSYVFNQYLLQLFFFRK